MDIGEAHQQIASALFGFVELTGTDEVDNCIGSRGEFIVLVVEVRIDQGFRSDRPRGFGSSSGSQGLVVGGLVFFEAAVLVFLTTATPRSPSTIRGVFATATISFNLQLGASLSEATAEIARARAEIHMPATIRGSLQGTARVFEQSIANEPILILAARCSLYRTRRAL